MTKKRNKILFEILLSLGLICIAPTLFAQTLNYCHYFKLDVTEFVRDGNTSTSCSPELSKTETNKFSKFLDFHQNRFLYILYKQSKSFSQISKLYPDTIAIQSQFCKQIINSQSVIKYFNALSPKSLVPNTVPDTFTVAEMMQVASTFFYCDGINKKDTSIQSHICIGINGISGLQSNRDLTVLEAFTFDAIFSYLSKKKNPPFYDQFFATKKQLRQEQLPYFQDYESFLVLIRQKCYAEMINNEDLKKKLISAHKKNKSNLNFILTNQ